MRAARHIVVNLNTLHLKADVTVLNSTIKFCVSIDEIDRGNVMGNKWENLLFRLLIHDSGTVRIVVLKLTEHEIGLKEP